MIITRVVTACISLVAVGIVFSEAAGSVLGCFLVAAALAAAGALLGTDCVVVA